MKITIELDLDADNGDEHLFKLFRSAEDMSLFISEFEAYLRTQRKYAEVLATFDEIDEEYYKLKSQYCIDIC